MADKNTKAKYFCENCNSEVAANARFCPKCGKFFSSVRCPKCGKLGTVKDFKSGCPRCHYAMTQEDIYGTSETPAAGTADGLKHKLSRKSKKAIKDAFGVYQSKQSKNRSVSSDAPLWVVILSFVFLALIIAMIFYRCQ